MKAPVLSLASLILLSCLVPVSPALAGRGGGGGHGFVGHGGARVGHGHFRAVHGHSHGSYGVFFGSLWYPFGYPYYGYPLYGSPYYGYPYYAYPPAVYDPLPDYSTSATAQPPSATWYYCREAKTYYPYVSECPGGWESVPATPPEPAPSGKSK
ncbi:MAG: hypothetical protein H6R11_1730 [Proteobacteria bacterium]|nr:hypothetical protein [Pseudomonadota bacterium]